jgi:hypothetical protein
VTLSSIAAAGLSRADAGVDRAGAAVVRSAAPRAAPADTVDLSTAAVDLLAARAGFAANAKLAAVAGRLDREALDLLG